MGKKKIEVQYGPRISLKGQIHNPGKWTSSQNKRYLAFLTQNKQKLQNRNLIRQCRIYKAMAHKIPGRTSDQCRGHHRKMVQVYKTIDKILQSLSKAKSITKSKNSQNKKYQGQNLNIVNYQDQWTIQIDIGDDFQNKNQKKYKQSEQAKFKRRSRQNNNIKIIKQVKEKYQEQQQFISQKNQQSKQNPPKGTAQFNKNSNNNKVKITITLNMDKVGQW